MNSTAVCMPQLTLRALPGLPVIQPGDDLGGIVAQGLDEAGIALRDGDVLVVTSKVVSRAEDRFVDLAAVEVSRRADVLAAEVGMDPRLAALILQESTAVSRAAPGALIVRHRLGSVSANAGIDLSNAAPPGEAAPGRGPWALLMPEDPDASAERLRAELGARAGVELGVVISDSLGRPFRQGSVGAAVGVAGMAATIDHRGSADLFGRVLEHTVTALADQVAAAADLVAGQGAEGRAVVHVRGLCWARVRAAESSARALLRPVEEDLYA